MVPVRVHQHVEYLVLHGDVLEDGGRLQRAEPVLGEQAETYRWSLFLLRTRTDADDIRRQCLREYPGEYRLRCPSPNATSMPLWP